VTFKKGNQLRKGIGRGVGTANKLPEGKDVLARAYTELGGFKGFVDWCRSSGALAFVDNVLGAIDVDVHR
jgi:hypothetical protein